MGCKQDCFRQEETKKEKRKFKYAVVTLKEAIAEILSEKSTAQDFVVVEIEHDDVIDIVDITIGDCLNEDDYIVLRKTERA